MRVIVYVEGPSDRAAMEELLGPLLEIKRTQGVQIEIFPARRGDAKSFVCQQVPLEAAHIIVNDPNSIVVTLPDLYPRNKPFAHESFEELERGIYQLFYSSLEKITRQTDERLTKRFKVFCFKHDLETLILAAKEALEIRLNLNQLEVTWTIPVENQDHDYPPKRIVEEIFRKNGQKYQDTIDAPLVLGLFKDYQSIAEACPQCFKPFVEFLKGL